MSETPCDQDDNSEYGDLNDNQSDDNQDEELDQVGEMVDLDEMPDDNMDDEETKPEEVEVNFKGMMQKKKVDKHDFEVISVLGKGGFGKVLQVRKTGGKDKGEIYAMKIVKKVTILKSEKDITHTKAERNILQDVQHPFIVEMKYAFQTEGKLYMILEFAQGGELFNLLEQENIFDEEWASFYLAEITLALGHLHTNGVIYRDLKPENILLDREGHVKLADFGLCKQNVYEGSDLAQTFCGTVEYMAPEIVKNNYRRQFYGKEVDWWSLGILMYDMMNGQPPFQADTKQKTMEMVMHGRFQSFPFWTHHHKDLQFKLLKRDRCKRLGYGVNDFKDIIGHHFFKKIDMDKLYNRAIQPPYIPQTKDILDKSGFDEKFTSMPIAETPMADEVNQVKKAIADGLLKPKDYTNVFDGFSYVDPRVMESFAPEMLSNEVVQSYIARSFKVGSMTARPNTSMHHQIKAQKLVPQSIKPQQPPLREVTNEFSGLSTKDNMPLNQLNNPFAIQNQPITTQANHPVQIPMQPLGNLPTPMPGAYPVQQPQTGGYMPSGVWVPFPSQKNTIPQPVYNNQQIPNQQIPNQQILNQQNPNQQIPSPFNQQNLINPQTTLERIYSQQQQQQEFGQGDQNRLMSPFGNLTSPGMSIGPGQQQQRNAGIPYPQPPMAGNANNGPYQNPNNSGQS